ncbi:hypothetical protein FOMPIDRAFT_1021535 [Fomitopsis schrenkii]|uniref:Uncharacterized protein n=1 Tax=Fomitopsis schrenkii TaxID=2126942 RepID=S8G4S8_FOMSC|nr:hypothetical protein FOMPIDRAFT_1021535 [Fomitopsis schrenkii]
MGAAASLPHPPGYPPGYPPLPFPVQTPQWPPWTPTHRSHRSQQDRQSGLSSPDAGPSGSWSYNTPSHSHPYPFTFNPAYSSASLPPSSPPASSEPPSPIVRSSSLARGRSKSRGRRVSFKLDSSKRPILPSPPRFDHDDASDDAAAGGSRQVQAHGDTSEQPATRPKAQSRVSGRAGTPAVKPDKGKARADHAEDSDGSDRGRGRRRERGRTPGPPAHSERSASARAAGRKT